MDPLIKAELEQEQMTDFHQALLKHVKELVDMSRKCMSTYYDEWDASSDTYEGRRLKDKSDSMAAQRGEPEKMIVPLTYAQIQTLTAFCISLYTQREHIFELVGKGEEDHKAAKLAVAVLDRDLTYNKIEAVLYQFLVDVARFGLGIIKTAWVEETVKKMITVDSGSMTLGTLKMPSMQTEVEQSVVHYQGNRITNVSPYRFFPDVRLPLGRFQEGEFCASEDDYSLVSLRQMEADGLVAGIQWVKAATKEVITERHYPSRLTHNFPSNDFVTSLQVSQTTGIALLTEVQVSLIPSEFKINGEPMGPETTPVKYVIWYVNDKRVVKCEPMGYVHNLYTYDIGEYSPDMHNLVSRGLASTIDQLQSVITWLINSHVTSVRKTIQNWLLVDPQGVEMKDLVERRPVIRLRSEVAMQGVDKFAKQLDVRDVTANHMNDAVALQSLVQIVTGINDNALGQFHTGRRSATEARNVNSATAARLKMLALLLFRTTLEPMARKMLSNLQDGLTMETYVRVMGEMADPMAYMQFTKVTKDNLVGEFDFEVFDGTLPSERSVQAEALGDFLLGLMKSPDVVMLLGYDPRKLVEEWLELRGIRNPKRFLLDQVRAAELQQQLMLQQQNGQPQPGLPQGAGTAPSNGGGPVPLPTSNVNGGRGGSVLTTIM